MGSSPAAASIPSRGGISVDKVNEAAAHLRKANDEQLQLPTTEAAKEAQVNRFDLATQVRNQRQHPKKKGEVT